MGMIEAHSALAGKKAAIIGGAAGIGRAVTLALAKAGVEIATCDVDETAAHTIKSEVEPLGTRILSVHADAVDVDGLERFYDQVESEYDSLDILVNIAGGCIKRELFADSTREQNAADIRLNYGYVLDSVRRAIPLLRKSGQGGSIINFTTIEAHRGAASYAVYAGAKAATTNFTRAVAVELAAEGIRVNSIAPDTTPSLGVPVDAEFRAKMAALGDAIWEEGFGMYIPQKRRPTPDDLANAVLFLASDLSRAITGTTIHVDGGTIAALGFLDWPFGDGFSPAPMMGTLSQLFLSAK